MKTMFSSNPIVLEKLFFLKDMIFIPLTWVGLRLLINRDSSRVHKQKITLALGLALALALAIKLSQNHKYAKNTKTFHEPS